MLAACEKHARKQHNRLQSRMELQEIGQTSATERYMQMCTERERERARERERERETETETERERECPPSLSFAMWGDFSWPSRYQRAVATQRDVK